MEAYAARELRAHIGFAIGLRLKIVRSVDRPGRLTFVGESAAMRDSAAGFSTKDFGPEQQRIVVRDGLIAIAGGRALLSRSCDGRAMGRPVTAARGQRCP